MNGKVHPRDGYDVVPTVFLKTGKRHFEYTIDGFLLIALCSSSLFSK